ncbi:hypothetical protein BKI52_43845 [marine bacterium AO1-C]|nr:hypothetical protein BKI52_43845 [marine bacterium AO1-C]
MVLLLYIKKYKLSITKHFLSLFYLSLLLWSCGGQSEQTNQTDTTQNIPKTEDTVTQAVSKTLTSDTMNTNEQPQNSSTTTQKTCENEGDTLTIKGVKTVCLDHLRGPIDKLLTALQKGDSLKVVCFGNSITNGYKVGSFGTVANPYPYVLERLLKKKYPNAGLKVVKEGHNGWRSDQGAKNLDQLVLVKKPDFVTLMFGINDAYAGWTTTFFQQQMERIITQLKAQNIEVIVLGFTPFTTPYNEKAITYLPVLKNLAQKHNCGFVNLHKTLLERIQKDKLDLDKVFPDEVHFGDEYYALIAEEIFGVMMAK